MFLSSLSAHNNMFTRSVGGIFFKSLLEMADQTRSASCSLVCLDLSECSLDDIAVADHLERLLTHEKLHLLVHLRLAGNRLGSSFCDALSLTLEGGKKCNLELLDLGRNIFGYDATMRLLDAVSVGGSPSSTNHCLKVLQLENTCGSTMGDQLQDVWERSQRLKLLERPNMRLIEIEHPIKHRVMRRRRREKEKVEEEEAPPPVGWKPSTSPFFCYRKLTSESHAVYDFAKNEYRDVCCHEMKDRIVKLVKGKTERGMLLRLLSAKYSRLLVLYDVLCSMDPPSPFELTKKTFVRCLVKAKLVEEEVEEEDVVVVDNTEEMDERRLTLSTVEFMWGDSVNHDGVVIFGGFVELLIKLSMAKYGEDKTTSEINLVGVEKLLDHLFRLYQKHDAPDVWRREQYYTWKVEQCLMRHWLPTLMNMFTTSAGGGAVRSGTFVSERRVSMTFRSMTFREFLCCMILKGVGGVGDYANNSLSFLFALPLSENGNQSLSFIHFVECVARIADRWHKSLFYNQENQEEDQEKDQEEDQEEEKTKMKTKVTLDLKIDMFMTYLKASQVKQ